MVIEYLTSAHLKLSCSDVGVSPYCDLGSPVYANMWSFYKQPWSHGRSMIPYDMHCVMKTKVFPMLLDYSWCGYTCWIIAICIVTCIGWKQARTLWTLCTNWINRDEGFDSIINQKRSSSSNTSLMRMSAQAPKLNKHKKNHNTKECSSLDSIYNNLFDYEICSRNWDPNNREKLSIKSPSQRLGPTKIEIIKKRP